jgi:dimethylargininase
MSKSFGSQSMVDPLRRVLVKRPEEAFAAVDPVAWNYVSRPDLEIARSEHDDLVSTLRSAGAEVLYHDESQNQRADAIFVYDPVLMTGKGVVVLSPGKQLRRGEEEVLARRLEALDIPVLYRLHGDARAEGGDCLWVDPKTLAVGLGFRTNPTGVAQLREALTDAGAEVVTVDLPYCTGPRACLHLGSYISFVDDDLAVANLRYMSVTFWRFLKDRGFEIVEVPDQELDSMGPNVLALAPRKCLMLEGNAVTKARLEAAGCEVLTYRGEELSLKAEGGPTCLTQPIFRESRSA